MALVLGAVLAVCFENSGDIATVVGYGLGAAIIPLAIAQMVLWWRSSDAAWKTMFVLFGLVTLGIWNSHRHEDRSNLRAETASLREDVAKTLELDAQLRAGQLPEPAVAPPVTDRHEVGLDNVAKTQLDVVRLTRRYYKIASGELMATMSKLATEEALLPIGELLAPRSLVSTAGIQKGRRTLERYGLLVNKREDAIKRYSEYLTAKYTSAIPAERFPEFWRSYNASSKSRDALAGEMIENQRKLVAAISSILELMKAQVGHTEVGADRLLFEDEGAMNEYNQLMAEFNRLAEEEAKLQTRLDAQNDRAIETIDQFAQSFSE